MDAGLAVRVPRGAHPRAAATTSSTTSPSCRSSSSARPTDRSRPIPNACLHRGRQLKDYDGHCSEIRCAFHGFAWDLDGNLADVPAAWDFPHVDQRPTTSRCPSARSAPGPASCSSTPIPTPRRSRTSRRDRRAVRGVGPGEPLRRGPRRRASSTRNWKIAQEAFCEAYHVNATHPQILHVPRRRRTARSTCGTACSRVITPGGTAEPAARLDTDLPSRRSCAACSTSASTRRRRSRSRRDRPPGPSPPRCRASGGGRRRRLRRPDERRRDDGQHRLHAVPELPPVGCLQPDHLPVPAQRRRSPVVDHGGVLPRRRSRASDRRRRKDHRARRRRPVDRCTRARHARQGVRPGRVQHGQGAEGSRDAPASRGSRSRNYQESKIRWLHQLLGEWVSDTTDTPVSVGTRS